MKKVVLVCHPRVHGRVFRRKIPPTNNGGPCRHPLAAPSEVVTFSLQSNFSKIVSGKEETNSTAGAYKVEEGTYKSSATRCLSN